MKKFKFAFYATTIVLFATSCSKDSLESSKTLSVKEAVQTEKLNSSSYENSMHSDSLQWSVYNGGTKVMDFYPNVALRYYGENTYKHEIIAEYTLDSIDFNTRIYRNPNNTNEYFKMDNIEFLEAENKIKFTVAYSYDLSIVENIEIRISDGYANQELGKGKWIKKIIVPIIKKLIEGGDDGGDGGAAGCAATAYATCNGCVQSVSYSDGGWFGSETCSFVCG